MWKQIGRAGFILALLLCSQQAIYASEVVEGDVVLIRSGDLIGVLQKDNLLRTVELVGVAAPAVGQPFHDESLQHLADLLYQKRVKVEVFSENAGGKLIGRVTYKDADVGLAQIRDGMAWARTKGDYKLKETDEALYTSAEESARASSLGLWSGVKPVEPWKFKGKEGETYQEVKKVELKDSAGKLVATEFVEVRRIKDVFPDFTGREGYGLVIILCTVDEEGKVIEARAFSGPGQLIEPSLKAAYQTPFRPAALNGKRVKVVRGLVFSRK